MHVGVSGCPPVIVRSSRSINLSRQGAALDATVLEEVRRALRLNDFYIQLNLSDNALSDESVALLCALLKDRTYLETLELRSCGLTDKDFTLYLMPAVLARNRLRVLDLSKNDRITDACVDALCRLIREGELHVLRLVGTCLTRAAGRRIADTIEGNTALEQCALPFTVGFDVLNRVSLLLQRNVQHKASAAEAVAVRQAMSDMLTEAREAACALSPADAVVSSSTVANGGDGSGASGAAPARADTRTRRERVALARYYTTRGRKNAFIDKGDAKMLPCIKEGSRASTQALSTATSCDAAAAAAASPSARLALPGIAGGPSSTSVNSMYAELHDFGTLRAATFRSITDPAISRSLSHLRVLDARCAAVEAYRQAIRHRRRERRGLPVESATDHWWERL